MSQISKGIEQSYNYNFSEAMKIYDYLQKQLSPGHPACTFYYAIILYWKYYPLSTNDPMNSVFIDSLNATIEKADIMLNKNEYDAEASFLSLFPKCLLMLHYSENDLPGKVIKLATVSYRQIINGYSMKEEFNDFYFTTGLYNYYREMYPQDHPVYKPVVKLFHSGDREKGLEQLVYASIYGTFIKAEANTFLSDIYVNYERKYDAALEYARQLTIAYPNNPLFLCKYIKLLIINRKYEAAQVYIDKLEGFSKYNFVKIYNYTFRGLIEEMLKHDYKSARNYYHKAEQLLLTNSIAYMDEPGGIAYYGLSRVYKHEDNKALAEIYFKKAKECTYYDHVLLCENQWRQMKKTIKK